MKANVILNPNQEYDSFIYRHFGTVVVDQLLDQSNPCRGANLMYLNKHYKVLDKVNELNLKLMVNKLHVNGATDIKVLTTNGYKLVGAIVELETAYTISKRFNQVGFVAQSEEIDWGKWKVYDSCVFPGYYYKHFAEPVCFGKVEPLYEYGASYSRDKVVEQFYKVNIEQEQDATELIVDCTDRTLRRWLKDSRVIYTNELLICGKPIHSKYKG